jgi:hypothetical protein
MSYELDSSFISYIISRKRSLIKMLNQANKRASKKNKNIMNNEKVARDL